jgi:hypothetical protein
MSGTAPVGGDFWRPEQPDLRVRGLFKAEVGKKLEVILADRLLPDPQVRLPPFTPGETAAYMAALAKRSVAGFRPIVLQGQLDSGIQVTLLDSRHDRQSGQQHFIAPVAVQGALVPGPDQGYTSVRFRVDNPYSLAHLPDGESCVVNDDQSILSVEASEAGNWLVYASSAPATLRQLEIRVVSGCLALMWLALYPDRHDLAIGETQVRLDPDGPWLTVLGVGSCAEPGPIELDTLLAPGELTLERFAKWIAINDQLDGLAWAVAKPLDVPLQVQAQVFTSLVEGLHRRLPFQQSYFPAVSDETLTPALRRIRKAAREAAAEEAQKLEIEGLDPELVRDLVSKAIGHVGQFSYQDRAKAVVAKVCGAVPEIGKWVANLPARLTDPRHNFAHQLPQDETKESLEVRVRRWIVVSQVTPWLLRVLLLLEVGVEPGVLHKSCVENERFAFFSENVAQLVDDLGWERPSPDKSSG